MAAELHPLLGQLAQLRKAHHLVSAAVGQDRARPVHELVQPAKPRDPLRTRAKHQMVGITQDDVRTSGAHAFRLHRLRSEEHTSELQSLMRISYAVFCLKKKNKHITHINIS